MTFDWDLLDEDTPPEASDEAAIAAPEVEQAAGSPTAETNGQADVEPGSQNGQADQVVVVGSGLAGLAAANTVLELRGRVVVLDKSSRCGGSPERADSGISAAGTRMQKEQGIRDNPELFAADAARGSDRRPKLLTVLCWNSGRDIEWLVDKFGLDLSLITQLAGHSAARTHRGAGWRNPGALAVRRLLEAVEAAALERPDRVRVVTRARATRLLIGPDGSCCGCAYSKGGVELEERGPVILCTGGFAADFSEGSLLAQYRPDLLHLPTASSEHCTGDGLRMGGVVGARMLDLEWVQVHPTGLVKLDDRDAKVKPIAAEMLRSAGGLLLNQDGDRFCNEHGRPDHVACEMWKSKPPIRLVLNRAAAAEADWHCQHYTERGLMRRYDSGEALARDMGVPLSRLEATLEAHFQAATAAEAEAEPGKSGKEPGERAAGGTTRCRNAIPGAAAKAEPFHVAVVTPVIHYCMGGLEINTEGAVVGRDGEVIKGLYAAGEVTGGVHGANYLGGTSLIECVVFGRVAGKACFRYALSTGERASEPQRPSGPSRNAGDAEDPQHRPASIPAPGAPQPAGPSAAVAATPSTADVRTRVALGQVNRLLEARLTSGAVQAALVGAHTNGGDLGAAVDELCRILLGDAAADQGAHTLNMSLLDRSQSGPLPTPVARVALPNAGGPCSEVSIGCVHCRLPLTLGVRHGGSLTDAESCSTKDPPEGPHAFATLLYGDKAEYFLGALVIGWSLKATGSTVDRLLLHTDDVPAPYLEVLARLWTLRQVQYLEGSPKLYKNYQTSRFKAVFTKLQALSCTDYAKVLMLDLDMLVRASLDELFRLRTPAALKRASGREQPTHGGTFTAEDMWRNNRDDMCSGINAGVMLLQPDSRVYERMVAEIADPMHPEHLATYGPEQDYLSRFYSTFLSGEWTHIHAKFNYQLMLPDDYVSSAHRNLHVLRDVVVAHYSGPRVKPWKFDTDIGVMEVRRLLSDDSLQAAIGQDRPRPRRNDAYGGPHGGPAPPRERVMDGVSVVEDGSNSTPPDVRAVMWEWVLALRDCAADLRCSGVELDAVVEEAHRLGGHR